MRISRALGAAAILAIVSFAAIPAEATPPDANDLSQARAICGSPDDALTPGQRIAACPLVIKVTGVNETDRVHALINRGIARNRSGDHDLALQDFDAAIRLKPESAEAYQGRGMALIGKHDYEHAIEAYDLAIARKPANLAEDFAERGTAYAESHDYSRAIADYKEAIRRGGEWFEVIYNLRMAYDQKGDFVGAIEADDAMIRLRPADGGALNSRCWHRAEADIELEAALTDCDSARLLIPGSPEVLDSRGLVLIRLGRFDEAIGDYDAALKIVPKFPSSLFGRGVAKSRKGDAAGAAADVASARAIDPNIAAAFAKFGVAP